MTPLQQQAVAVFYFICKMPTIDFNKDVIRQKKRFPFGNLSVGLPGLEPGKAGPESAVLPLHHSPRLICDAKVQLFFVIQIVLPFFLLKK